MAILNLLCDGGDDGSGEERDARENVGFRERVVLHQACVAKLDSDRVVNDDEDVEESVSDEVFLPIVAQHLVVFSKFSRHLVRVSMNWLIAHKGNSEPEDGKAPESSKLDKQLQ